MRDAADMTGKVVTARLMRDMDVLEAKQRNALSVTRPGLSLVKGDTVNVVETFDSGSAFLVEFTKGGKPKMDSCDWMGVVYPAEIEVVDVAVKK